MSVISGEVPPAFLSNLFHVCSHHSDPVACISEIETLMVKSELARSFVVYLFDGSAQGFTRDTKRSNQTGNYPHSIPVAD